MRRKKLVLRNSFHNTKIVIIAEDGVSPYAAYQDVACAASCGDKNARRKLRRINKVLCGMQDCTCGIIR